MLMPSNIFVNACLLYPYCSVVTWPLTSIHDNGDDMECDRGGQYTFSANASQSCQGALHNNFPPLSTPPSSTTLASTARTGIQDMCHHLALIKFEKISFKNISYQNILTPTHPCQQLSTFGSPFVSNCP